MAKKRGRLIKRPFILVKSMNKKRKEYIFDIKKELTKTKEKVESVLDEEQNAFDNMPENLQGSLRGTESEEAIDVLEECSDYLEKIINKLYEII